MRTRKQYITVSLVVLIAIIMIAILIRNNRSNNDYLQAEVVKYRQDIQNANLIGKESFDIFKYLNKRHLPYEYYGPTSSLTLEPRRTAEVRIFGVAHTFDLRGPQNWNIVIEFHFDERNRLKTFEIIEEGDGF